MKRTLCMVALLALVASSTFATNGTRIVGFNAVTVGRGGTSIGVFDNPSLMMTNPAGLAFLSGSSLDLTAGVMAPTLGFANGINSAEGKKNYYPLPSLSYVNSTGGDFAWGIGAFTQGGMGSQFSLNHALFLDGAGKYVRQEYFSKLGMMNGGLSAAYKLTPTFSVGASAHLAYSMLDMRMPYSLSPSIMKGVINPVNGMTFGDMFAGPPAQGGFGYREVTAYARMDDLTALGFSGKAGLAWTPNENVSLGISYTSSSPLTYKKGKAKMDMTAQFNDAFGKAVQGYMMQNPGATPQQAQQAVAGQFTQLGIDLSKGVAANYNLDLKLTFPQSIGFGIGVKAADNIRVSADFEWINWKSAFDKMTLNLSNGDNANINRMLGNSGTFSLDFPLNWEDAYVARLGMEWDATAAWTFRLGGAFGTNPVADATVFPVFPAIVENHLMVGASYHVIAPLTIHAAYERALPNAQVGATTSLIAQEYNNASNSLSESLFHLSLSWMFQ